MADSGSTKKALANSLKSLMAEVPFVKINIADICERCQMNRKSFYYHFRDKYELLNWIFDAEFIKIVKKSNCQNIEDVFDVLFVYFYENRSFYKKALQIDGQNSFTEHFRELCQPVFTEVLESSLYDKKTTEFHVNFISDALMCAILRWLTSPNCMEPEKFSSLLKSSLKVLGTYRIE